MKSEIKELTFVWKEMMKHELKKKRKRVLILEKNVKKHSLWFDNLGNAVVTLMTQLLHRITVGLTMFDFGFLWCFLGISGGVEPKQRMWLKWIDPRQAFRWLMVHDFFWWWSKTCLSNHPTVQALVFCWLQWGEVVWFSKEYFYTFFIHVWVS